MLFGNSGPRTASLGSWALLVKVLQNRGLQYFDHLNSERPQYLQTTHYVVYISLFQTHLYAE